MKVIHEVGNQIKRLILYGALKFGKFRSETLVYWVPFGPCKKVNRFI